MRPFLVITGLVAIAALTAYATKVDPAWPIHSETRPESRVVTPGTFSTQDAPGTPPSDAIVLFDGKDLSQWETPATQPGKAAKPAAWKVADGVFECVPKSGGIATKKSFGDMQLHIEWSSPVPPKGNSQGRGNSGVFLAGVYELQVLDSYQNKTYADGAAGAMYGQFPPQVNPVQPPGKWNMYDVVFHGPHYGADGNVTRPAIVTVFFNGVLVQDHVELTGPTANKMRPPYGPGMDRGPISLQDHGHAVRYRNVWVREIPDAD